METPAATKNSEKPLQQFEAGGGLEIMTACFLISLSCRLSLCVLSDSVIQLICVAKGTGLGLIIKGGANRPEGPMVFIQEIAPGGDCQKVSIFVVRWFDSDHSGFSENPAGQPAVSTADTKNASDMMHWRFTGLITDKVTCQSSADSTSCQQKARLQHSRYAHL